MAGVASLTSVLSALGTSLWFWDSSVRAAAGWDAIGIAACKCRAKDTVRVRSTGCISVSTVPSIALLALLCKHAGAIRRGPQECRRRPTCPPSRHSHAEHAFCRVHAEACAGMWPAAATAWGDVAVTLAGAEQQPVRRPCAGQQDPLIACWSTSLATAAYRSEPGTKSCALHDQCLAGGLLDVL